MNLSSDRPIMVFKREYNGRVFYSLGLSKKDRNNNYINGYMACEFRKGVSLESKTRIYIKNAFLTFYLKDKKTIPYIKVLEFETVEETIQNSKDIFKDFGEQVAIDDNFLE
jgi:hypothetical protein